MQLTSAGAPDATAECEIIAETLYIDGRTARVKVKSDPSGLHGITDCEAHPARETDIFSIQGICLKRNASPEDIKALHPGFYIIGGKKVRVGA